MPYNVTVNREQGFVHLVYSGNVDFPERLEARDRVFEMRRQHDLTRSLVETQDSNMGLTTNDIIQFAKSFPADLPPRYHVAVVVAPGDKVDTLLENLASTAGLTIKAFIDRDDALKWLTAF